MQIGKIPESVLKGLILNNLGATRREVLLGSGIGEDCSALALEEDEIFVVSTDPITGTTKDIGALAVTITVNDLASSGAEAIGILLTILLPSGSEETLLKEIMSHVHMACQESNVSVLGGHTEVSSSVTRPILSVTGIGKVKKNRLITSSGAKCGMDIIATKWIGLEGTSIIAKEKFDDLSKEFPEDFVTRSAEFDKYISVRQDGLIAAANGAMAMHDVTEGGILGALWELAEASNVGLSVNMSDIPIRQETIEICEHYHINPYKLISSGCMLIVANQSEQIISALKAEGIEASIIGKTTDSNDRIIHYDGKDQHLTPPSTDELYKIV